jgi:hypothetical protein
MARIAISAGMAFRATAIGLAGLLAIFGLLCLPVFLGGFNWRSEWKKETVPYLENCPPNEIRFGYFSPRILFGVKGRVDLQKGLFHIVDDGAVSHLIIGDGKKSDRQIIRIKQLIERLPDDQKWFYERYDFGSNVYIAIRKENVLRIFEYPSDDLPQEVQVFLNAINPAETQSDFNN